MVWKFKKKCVHVFYMWYVRCVSTDSAIIIHCYVVVLAAFQCVFSMFFFFIQFRQTFQRPANSFAYVEIIIHSFIHLDNFFIN